MKKGLPVRQARVIVAVIDLKGLFVRIRSQYS